MFLKTFGLGCAVAALTASVAVAQPAGVLNQDVGTPTLPGSYAVSAGKITIVGGGNDIWGNFDNFHFAYVSVTNNFDWVVKVESLAGPDHWTKAELMAREPGASNLPQGGDRFIANMTTRAAGQNEVALQWRSDRGTAFSGFGSECAWPNDIGIGAPLARPAYPNTWLRLKRIDSKFWGYSSTNGTTWTLLRGSPYDFLALNGNEAALRADGNLQTNLHLGLAVTAHNDGDPTGGVAVFSEWKAYTPVPIQITTQPPATLSVPANTTLTITAVVAGDPVHFQWQKGGVDLTNQTSATLTIPLVQTSDAGSYALRSYSGQTSVTSTPTVVTVTVDVTPPTITTQPVSVFRRAGENATFSVTAAGQPPLHYQWRKGTGILANATNSSLTITNAQADASYYVVVSNPNGSATSQSAQLKILVDYNTDIPPVVSPTPEPPQPKQPSQHNLVVVTHGWQLGSIMTFDNNAPQWVYDMTNSIGNNLANSNWTVFALGWNGLSGAATAFPGGAAKRAEVIGKKFGLGISAQGWSHVHFIGHSAGAVLIQAAAETLRANSASPVVIHTTFLDPYNWSFFGGPSRFGAVSDWSDHYFESDPSGPLTGGRLDNSYNVNISALDHTFIGSHAWAYHFYSNTITGDLGNISEGFGFPLSKEGGNWNYAINTYHPSNSPYLLGGGPSLVSSSGVPIQNNPNLVVSALSSLWSGTVYVTLNGFDLFTSLISPQKPEISSAGSGGGSFGAPAWLSLAITVTNRINFVRFDASFTSATNSAGLLTVYWNTNEIGVADETVTTPGLKNYSFALPATYSSGNYVLGFRLDSFANIVSSISITNVSLGFAGLTNPITLGISRASGSNQLTLTGPSNYNYLVQSSSNLVDWIPAAIVPNTNGTAVFNDPATTNYSRRFYRAVSP